MGAGVTDRSTGCGPPWPVVLLAAVAIGTAIAMLATARGARPPRPLAPRLVDLDRADAVDLDLLPGVGPALAARIIEDRTANGPFGSPESLARVRGVGPATIEGLRPFVRGGGSDRDDG